MSTYITTLSDSDLSLNLSEGSALSSESDHSLEPPTKSTSKKLTMADKKKKKPAKSKKASNSTTIAAATTTTTTTTTTTAAEAQPKKGTKQVKDEELYCICRQGYDGKQFMIACDTCHEWFHGQCVGINPKSVSKHYYCDVCQSKTTKKKSTNQDTPPKVTTNGKGRGKKKSTTTSARKKSNQDANISIPISIPLPPAPSTTQPVSTPTNTTTISAAMDQDDEDEDLDDICPICEFECTCGTSTTSASTPAPVPVLILPTPSVSSLDTPRAPSSKTKKGTIKKQPKTQSAISKQGKTAKKIAQYTPLSDEEDVDILDDIDDDGDHVFNNATIAIAEDDDDNDSLVMDPFSADEELSSDDGSDPQLDNLSFDHDSQFGSYSSSIHIDSGDEDEEDIEQEEERAIIAEMMENGLSDNNSNIHQDDLNDSDDDEINGDYYIEDDYSVDLGGNDLDDDSIDTDEDDDDGGRLNVDDEEAHVYYLRTNGLWASSEEEDDDDDDDDEEDEDEDMGFHSDPGPLHGGSDEDDTTADLAALIGGDNNLFTNIAEAFMHVLAPLANVHSAHSESMSPTSLTTPVSALPLNVATFDLGSNAADYLNSAPTSPVSHRMDDFLRRPSLPSSAVLAANGHHDTDLASDALSMLSSVLSSEALGLPLHHHTSTAATATATSTASSGNDSKLVKEEEDLARLPALNQHLHHHESTTTSAPSLSSTTSSLSPSSSSPPQSSSTPTVSSPIAAHEPDAIAAITPINYTESSSPPPPSLSPLQQQQQQHQQPPSSGGIHSPIASASSATQPASPQPSYDLASLLPPDMKIPDQLMELIKSSLAASINEKGLLSSPTAASASSSSSSDQPTSNKKTPPGSSTLSRQLLPKPTHTTATDNASSVDVGPSNGSAGLNKKRPLSIVTQFGKKRQRGDDDTTEDKQVEKQDDDGNGLEDMMVSMDELLDTSQLDAARLDDDDDNDTSDDRFARDLSRWERVPIGAFRLMRSKNRLWLNR